MDCAFAISLVLAAHFFADSFPFEIVRRIMSFGWVGVDLFFVISGFLIGGILFDQRGATNYYSVFYTRRFFRIIPLYLLLITPAFLVVGLGLQGHLSGHSLGGQNAWMLLLYLCFMQNLSGLFIHANPGYLGPTWSLAVEEQFYLLLPPLVRKFRAQTLLKVLVAAVVVAPLLRGLLFLLFQAHGTKVGTACYSLLPCRWDSLSMGVLAAYGWRQPRFQAWLTAWIHLSRTVWLVLAVGMIMMCLSWQGPYHPIIAVGGYTWIAGFFTATLLLAGFNRHGWMYRLLSLPFLRPIATVSYGLYLLNEPIIAIKEALFGAVLSAKIGWAATGVNVLALGATGLAAVISWRFFESRLIHLGHKISYHMPPAPQTSSATPAVRVQKTS
jgi:peptidoglycan/LPS O-acetylase OafA/YrhL